MFGGELARGAMRCGFSRHLADGSVGSATVSAETENWEKSLRDRNRPTCTLSQNGYSENNEALWLDTILKSASHAVVKGRVHLANAKVQTCARIK